MAERFQLLDFAYAHRGLWGADGFPENSLEAILAAARAGIGCEFDVRPAACGTPIVFHDSKLDRMTHDSGFVATKSAEEITGLGLAGGGTLPTLSTVLDAWPGKTPLLIELKIDGDTDAEGFAAIVSNLLAAHQGPAAVMSFSPRAIEAISGRLMKGTLLLPSMLSDAMTPQSMVASAAALNPDFLACHVTDAKAASVSATDYGLPVAVWTVSSAEMAGMINSLPVAQIFEGFDPAFARPS